MTARKFAAMIVMVLLLASSAWGDTYTINSYADFRTYMLNSTYTSSTSSIFVLNTDIQLAGYSNWPGIGSSSSPFRGHFDGNGHTIYVNIRPLPPTGSSYKPIAEDRALFVNVGNGAVIDNLHVEGSVKGYNAGGIASIVDGATITNCSFSGDVSAITRKGDSLITDLIDELDDEQITNVNHIERADSIVSGDSGYKRTHRGKINAGGLVAVLEDGNITDCSFRGKVLASSDATASAAGGITGRFYEGSISSCDVIGDSLITAHTASTTDSVLAAAGGISGWAVTPLDSTIDSCKFEGTVESSYYAGGIVGLARGTVLSANSVLEDSDITATYSAGGIAGYLASGGKVDSNDVALGALVYAESYSAGGIVGYLDTGSLAVTNNTSYAAIRGNASYLGGIVGAVSNSTNATLAVGSGNSYSGASAGIGRDEYNRSTDGNTTPQQDITYQIITTSLPDGTVGVKYEASLKTNAAKTRTVTYSYSGNLPGGLDFGSDGTISGKPTESGGFTFTVDANIDGIGTVPSKDFTISIDRRFEITPEITSELTATVGELFTQAFSASNGATLTTQGSLPAGITATTSNSGSTITLSGYPQKDGTYTFSIEGTSGDVTSSTGTITLVVKPAIEFATLSLTPSTATQNEYYSTPLDVYLNIAKDNLSANSLVWSISSGTLPAGLEMSGDLNGARIAGTPSRSGEFSFTVKAELSFTAGTTAITAQASQNFTLTVETATVLNITTESLTGGMVGQSYNQYVEAQSSASWEISEGELPTGLYLTTVNGRARISGTPTEAGTYTFVLRAVNGTMSGTRTFTIVIDGGSGSGTTSGDTVSSSDTEVSLTAVTLDSGKEGTYYECTLSNDATSISSGNLPDGLSLSNNVISGTPTKAGKYTFVIGTYSYTIVINTALVILTGQYLPSAFVGEWYSYTISTDADQPLAVRWTKLSGDLPAGLTLNTLTGNISGFAEKIEVSTFTLQAALGNYLAVKSFSLAVAPSLTISGDETLPNGKVGVEYSHTFKTDSEYPIHWTFYDGDLPNGLRFSEGVLSGTPTEYGDFTFTLLADSGGLTSSKEFTLTIESAMSITTPSVLPAARTNKPYSYTLETDAPAGSTVYWSLQAYQDVITSADLYTHYYSRLPEGMYIDESTGTIFGTPTDTGVYYFRVTAVMGEVSARKYFTLNVRPMLTITTESPLPHAVVNELYRAELSCDAEASEDVTWSITGGNYPEGLTIDAKTGLVTVYPSSEGKYTFIAEAFSNGLRANKEFEFTAGQAMSIITDAIIPVLDAGEDFTLQLETDRGGNNSQWSLQAGRLPPGLTLNTLTGVISGQPVRAGAYTFIVKNVSGYSEAVKEFTINVSFVITSDANIDAGTSGTSYSYRFTAKGVNAASVLWSASQDVFPTGITLSSSGLLSGTTNESGVYSFMVSAFVSNDVYAQKFVTLRVNSYSALPIVTSQLPDGRVGEEYYAEIRSSVEGVSWKVSGLPAGLEAVQSDGVCAIAGVPTVSGTFRVLVSGETLTREAEKQFELTIVAAPVVSQESSGGGGGCYSGLGVLSIMLLAGVLRKIKH